MEKRKKMFPTKTKTKVTSELHLGAPRAQPRNRAKKLQQGNQLEGKFSLLINQPLNVQLLDVQWGSEIRQFKIQKNSKSGLFEGWISNGSYVVRFQMVQTIQKQGKIANLV